MMEKAIKAIRRREHYEKMDPSLRKKNKQKNMRCGNCQCQGQKQKRQSILFGYILDDCSLTFREGKFLTSEFISQVKILPALKDNEQSSTM